MTEVKEGWVCAGSDEHCADEDNWDLASRDLYITCVELDEEEEEDGDGGGGCPPGGGDPASGGGGAVDTTDTGGEGEAEACDCVAEEICNMLDEYEQFMVEWTPGCSDFRSGGSTAHFTWSEFNGNWSDGSEYGEHHPWGIMDDLVLAKVQEIRDFHGAPIQLTSGYRCPQGNTDVGSHYPRTSRHMYGRAVDIHTGGDAAFYKKIRDYAENIGFSYVDWTRYPDRHLHIQMN